MQQHDSPPSSSIFADAAPPGGCAVVIGGGLAGIAAALRLAERQVAVTLIEASDRLGGRATAIADPVHGRPLDNCQHVLLGCCTNAVDLYRRLGVADRIVWRRTLHFADRRGRIDRVEADDLPAPLHLVRSMLAMRTLTAREKLAIGRGLLAVLQIGDRGRRYLRDISFQQWLIEQGQPAGAVRTFWSPVIVSACNDRPENVAARYGVQVFQEGLLSHERAYEIGLCPAPLVELYGAAERALVKAGVRLLKSTAAVGFDFDGHRIAAVRLAAGDEGAGEGGEGGEAGEAGEKLRADAYVCAVPFDRLAELTSELMRISDPRLASLTEFEVSPMIGIHLYLEPSDARPLMPADLPYLTLIDSPVQWVFDRGPAPADGPLAGARWLHAVIAAGREQVNSPAADLAAMAHAELGRILPQVAAARLADHRVIVERRATFSPRPGVDGLRPATSGAIDNLLLAGDWVDTGWPATIEGAVRSGARAAAAALRLRDPAVRDSDLLAPSLPPGPLYRFMSG